MKTCTRRHQNGSAVIVVLALLSILLAYVTLNVATLQRLGQEVKAVEKHQVQRLHPDLPHPAPDAHRL